ncbi:MAG: L-threonylcarbamoyladenylate synthase [Syntrophobacteraceae bacterium]
MKMIWRQRGIGKEGLSVDPKPRIWKSGPDKTPREVLAEAASLLARGGVVIYPTETFYALGAVPLMGEALDRVFSVKGREAGKPLPLIGSGKEAVLNAVSGWPEAAEKLAGAFWPGPLTLVLPASSSLPSALHAGTGKVAIRVSSHPVAVLLAEGCGGLLVSTSANRSGEPPPSRPEEIHPDVLARADGFIDAGNLAGGFPSTIVDVAVFPPRLLRAGAVGWDEIRRVLAAGLP